MFLKELLISAYTRFMEWAFPPKFYSEEEIADQMFPGLNEESRRFLAVHEDKARLVKFHMSVGMSIRNTFNLWHPLNPYTDINDPLAENFPDQVSQRVIERLWQKSRDWVALQE